jgi:TorA maturation chaperone TorD
MRCPAVLFFTALPARTVSFRSHCHGKSDEPFLYNPLYEERGVNIDSGSDEHAEVYTVLSDLFLDLPDDEELETIKTDFGLRSREPLEEIAGEFSALFSFPHGTLQPIESIFRPNVMADSPDVVSFYSQAGLALDEEYDVAPDHLGLELLFMSYLIETDRTDLRKKFLAEHIINWVPDYCDEVVKQAKTLFYREIAEITKNFLAEEYEGGLI